jgi:capsular polysaccharide biosynthesis protein
MNLKELTSAIKSHKKLLLICSLLGLMAGLLVYFWPNTYTATGSIFVKRSVEESIKQYQIIEPTVNNTTTESDINKLSERYFQYEGYYAQQVAISFTNTLASLSESVDIRKKALESLNLKVDVKNLRKYGRLIRAKKMAPQLVSLTTKGNSEFEARELWNAVTEALINDVKRLNNNGDPAISISPISSEPTVTSSYKSLTLFSLVGALLGLTGGLTLVLLTKDLVQNKENIQISAKKQQKNKEQKA